MSTPSVRPERGVAREARDDESKGPSLDSAPSVRPERLARNPVRPERGIALARFAREGDDESKGPSGRPRSGLAMEGATPGQLADTRPVVPDQGFLLGSRPPLQLPLGDERFLPSEEGGDMHHGHRSSL